MTQDSSATRPWFCPRTNCPAPSHDTVAAYRLGCRSGAATEDRRLYNKRWRERRNSPRLVSPVGVARRIQACHAVGYTGGELADALRVSRGRIAEMRDIKYPRMHVSLVGRIVPILERMAMQPPPWSPVRVKSLTWARAQGFRPLLAWVDIDDPDEQPPTETPSEPPTLRAVDDLDLDALYVAVRERRRPLGELDARARSYVVERAWRVKVEEGYETRKLLHQTATLLNADPMLVSRTHASAVTRKSRALKEAS